jgi:hypothetical protein
MILLELPYEEPDKLKKNITQILLSWLLNQAKRNLEWQRWSGIKSFVRAYFLWYNISSDVFLNGSSFITW